jgi:hypothetical protein
MMIGGRKLKALSSSVFTKSLFNDTVSAVSVFSVG